MKKLVLAFTVSVAAWYGFAGEASASDTGCRRPVASDGVMASRGDLPAPRPDGFSIRGGLVEGAKEGPDFWALEFVRDGERYKLDNRADCRRRTEDVSGARRFIWEGLSLPGATGSVDVVATVKDGGAGKTEWLLKVANRL